METIKELMSLNGKRVLVTGATGNLGKQIVTAIAELGGELIVTDRPGADFSGLFGIVNELVSESPDVIECDLELESERSDMIRTLVVQNRNIDVLINNAAFVGESKLAGWSTNFENQSMESWRRAIEVNLTASFHLSQGLLPKLKENGRGVIINIASIYANSAPDYSLYAGTEMGNPAAYSISKAGLVQLTRWLAATVAPDVRVNAISPGGIFRNQDHKFVKRYIAQTPLQRMATEQDFKGAIAFLSSDLSGYITGHNLVVDGGWQL